MKFRDVDYLYTMSILIGVMSGIFTLNILFGFEMLFTAFIGGGIILYIRRGILKAKRKILNHEEKRQAV